MIDGLIKAKIIRFASQNNLIRVYCLNLHIFHLNLILIFSFQIVPGMSLAFPKAHSRHISSIPVILPAIDLIWNKKQVLLPFFKIISIKIKIPSAGQTRVLTLIN